MPPVDGWVDAWMHGDYTSIECTHAQLSQYIITTMRNCLPAVVVVAAVVIPVAAVASSSSRVLNGRACEEARGSVRWSPMLVRGVWSLAQAVKRNGLCSRLCAVGGVVRAAGPGRIVRRAAGPHKYYE